VKFPVGTKETEREVHHYVERTTTSEPVFIEIPFFPIALILSICLALFWGKIENRPPQSQPTTINIHVEK
jgi:hypothetical protein